MRKFILVNAAGFLLLVLVIETMARAVSWGDFDRNVPKTLPERVNLDYGSRFNAEGLGDGIGGVDTIAVEFKRFPYHVSTNSDGFRGSVERKEGNAAVLALGASYTFGAYINDADTYPFLLQSAFNKAANGQARIQVLNGGMPGYQFGSYVDYLRTKGSRLRPEIVLLQVGPTILDGTADLGAAFRKSAGDSSSWLQPFKYFLREHSAAARLAQKLRLALAARSNAPQGAGIDLLHVGEDIDSRKLMFDPGFFGYADHWSRVEKELLDLREIVSAFGGQVCLVVFPLIEQIVDINYPVDPQTKIAEIATRLGLCVVDLLPHLRGHDFEALTLTWYPRAADDFKRVEYNVELPKRFSTVMAGDAHYSRYGNYLISQAIHRALRDNPALARHLPTGGLQ